MTSIALFGAAGKIGTRITSRLIDIKDFEILYVESGEAALERLHQRGLTPTPQDQAVQYADVVILAVPDRVLADVAAAVVPALKPGALVITLDPAVPVSGMLPARADVAYFTVHPCHPPVVNDETSPEAKADFYGGTAAKQSIVCALQQGAEADYDLGERIARLIFAPILRVHRISIEYMALLEPAMAETVVLTCMFIMREAMEEAVARGVPREAAMDFLLGHINVNLGILFHFLPNTDFSDGAKKMVANAKSQLIQSDWKKVFDEENLRQQVEAIVFGR